ncbi:MAG: type II/IV secretion system ATPase subunit [Candidatus Pacearchaeota archaeon]
MKKHKKHKIKREVVKKHKHSKRIEKRKKHKITHKSNLEIHKKNELERYPHEKKNLHKPQVEKNAIHLVKNNSKNQNYKKLAPHQIHSEEHQIKAYKKAAEDKKSNSESSYPIEVDGAKVEVEIKKEEDTYVYNINLPKFSVGTESLLRYVKNELISNATINLQEMSEQESFVKMKQRFLGEITLVLKEKLPHIDPETEKTLAGMLMQDMLGLGEIEFLINDPNLEEIVIQSSKEPVRVYSKKYGWLKTNIFIPTEDSIINYANIIARRVGRQITTLDPLLDAHLLTGDRINAVLYPINSKGSTIIIRKFSRDPYTIIDLIKNKTCSLDIAALLWLAVEYEMNILVSGGTASGKTSFLNAFMPFIPPNHRIISIEDTRELVLPDFLYWNPLVTRTPNSEGKGKVTMLDLLVNSLRMRPDRIILGEMRKHEEAMVLFEAMHTGHSVYATLHADSAPETISRLINPPIDIPANLLKAVNLNVVMFRDRKKGIRRILQVAEFDTEGDRATSNIIYRWVPEKDQIIEHRESMRFFEDLSRHTGLSEIEIKKELAERKRILDWLIKNNLRSIKEVGNAIELFYLDKPSLDEVIRKNEISKIKE